MKYFSMFSGVEGFGLGIENGEPIGFSEIDKYASMVLKYHFPKVKNYGDCTTIKWEQVADFDLLVGGSPCQDFSIAGKRRGLKGSRSSLAWEFIRCLSSKKPRYFIWENVKGVMSSRGGWDFANILSAFSESGYSLWWQVLNAKNFGVPQNRERIFVIGFREGSPKEVFFESKDSRPIADVGTTKPNDRIGQHDRVFGTDGLIGALGAVDYKQPPQILHRFDSYNKTYSEPNIASTLKAGGDDPNIIVINKGESQHYRLYDTDGLAPILQSQSGMSSQKHPFIFAVNTKKGFVEGEEGDGINIAFPNSKTRRGRVIKKNSPTLQRNDAIGTIQNGQVRKLMPIECERLMSWPDDWTRWGIDDKGNKIEISDSQRYKMCGNGVVSNCVKEIVKNIL